MRISLFARAAAGTAAAVIASSGIAFALTGAPADLPDDAQLPDAALGAAADPEDAPEGTPGEDAAAAGQEEAEVRQAEAEANHAAATAFAEDIRAWTDCIQDNAANSDTPRDEGFDPKDGCEDVKPETTPSGEPFEPGSDDEGPAPSEAGSEASSEGADRREAADENRGDAGPADAGAPEDAGPPSE